MAGAARRPLRGPPPAPFAIVARAPIERIDACRTRMGWSIPWVSSFGTSFNPDFGVGPVEPQPDQDQDGETFGLSALLREGDAVYRTYFTHRRGVGAVTTGIEAPRARRP